VTEPSAGLVVGAHGRHVVVEDAGGRRRLCHLRGKKNEAVVGDRVRWQPAPGDGAEGVVERVEPRRNLFFRQDEWRTKSFAANLDGLLILVAGEPMFSEQQLARALVAAEAAQVPALIALNKTDLPSADLARQRLQPYRAMGQPVVELSLKTDPQGSLATLAPHLDGRTTLVLGPSGTGKSSLVNRLLPDAQAQVGEISQALNSGRHTTTTSTWYWLDGARRSALIDSPGFQEFGLRQVEAQDLPHLMPDLREHAGGCRFYNCTHRQEPGCAVRQAVEDGRVATSRWQIYQTIREELERTRW
jgi:ribosome biogenesis GTPase